MKYAYWTPKFKVSAQQKINPFFWAGNLDDPIPPLWYYGPEWEWFGRNPFHNLMWYVLGFADRHNVAYGKEPGKVFADELGWNYAITLVGGWFPMPFVSHRGSKFRWYAGWKCPNASLGFEFRRNS